MSQYSANILTNMATFQPAGQKGSGEDQGLSHEKLIEKYKSALAIAQKAKNARDEVINSNKVLHNENLQLKERVGTLERQFKTAEEMLAALTDHKLKLAMEIDDLKKEKRIYFEELKLKENVVNEAENYKSQYKKLLNDNEELISSTEAVVTKMKKDYEELKRQNDNLKQLCNNIQMEKSEIEKDLNVNVEMLNQYVENQNALNSVLSKKYNIIVDEFRKWAEIIDSREDCFAELQLCQMENKALKSEKEKSNCLIKSLTKDKETMEQEAIDLNKWIKKLCLELDAANTDRDKMLNNLEKVSLETKRLIDNSDGLTQELGKLKEDRALKEHMITAINNEKLTLSKIIEEKDAVIDELTSELRQFHVRSEVGGVDPTTEHMGDSDYDSTNQNRSVNAELTHLQQDLHAFSAQIDKYKIIAKESEKKLQEALEVLSEKEDLIEHQQRDIIELKSKMSDMECTLSTEAQVMEKTREQLLEALEKLGVIEQLRDKLEHDCKQKDEEFFVVCHKLETSDRFIKDFIEGVEGLRVQLNRIHEINSFDEEFNTETLNCDEYIAGLKKCLDAVTCKMYHKYQEEVENLKEIINEYQENNEALAIDNNKLSKQAKDLLNEQANYDSDLVIKLKTFKENLLEQIKEKQSVITKLENQVATLKEDVTYQVNSYKTIETQHNDLQCQYEKLLSQHSEEIRKLTDKVSTLESEYGNSLSGAESKNEVISTLEEKITNFKNVISNLENTMKNSELNDAIETLNSGLEKENQELTKLILILNSESADNLKELAIEDHFDNKDIKKSFNKLKLYNSLLCFLSKELEKLNVFGNGEKEEMKSELIRLSEDNDRLSNEGILLKAEVNRLSSSVSNLKEVISSLFHLCRTEQLPLTSAQVKEIADLLPQDLSEIFINIKELYGEQHESKSNIKKEELLNKILDLELLINEKEAFIKDELEQKNATINSLLAEQKSLNDKLDQISNINDSLNSDLSNFKENIERLRREYSEEKETLLDKITLLESEGKDWKELADFKTVELRENNRIWAGRFSSLKVALIGLNKTRKEIKNHFQSAEASFNSFVGQITVPLQNKVDLVVENAVATSRAELIGEMHQMNQALKERGETISRLELTLTECRSKIKQLTSVSERLQTELVETKTELEREKDAIREKDELIKQLRYDIDQLKESHETSTADADVLSTSTISKSEEHCRLKDVEDSFEDRYTKLKMIAVKLKKRAADLGQTLEAERNKAAAEKAELQDKMSFMSMAVKNAQKIQELFDESLDERDQLKKDNTHLKNTVEELRSNAQSVKSKISALESSNQSIPVMKKHIDSLNGSLKEKKSELQRIEMEMKAEVIKYEEAKKSTKKLESSVEELTRQLEQAKQQGKARSVLQLEINNYEKIIADLSSQLSIEKASTKNLKSENEALSNVKIGLEEQISILETQISIEEERCHKALEQVGIYEAKVEEKNRQIEGLNIEIGEEKKKITDEMSRSQALTVEMSSITSAFSEKEITMLSRISSLQDQVRSLETSLLSTKQELATSKREIEQLNEEYDSYKLRAQSILAKKKGALVTHGEKEAKEESDRLKQQCAALQQRLDAIMTEMDTLNTRLSSLKLEKVRSDKRYKEVRDALQQKLSEYDLLNSDFYNLKMANEIAIDQLKGELTKKKNEYQAELSHYKKIIDDLLLDLKRKEEEAVSRDVNSYVFSSLAENILPSCEREDAEGSESVPSPKNRRHSAVVPLDVLLNSPDESKVSVLEEQVEKLQKDLGSSELRARHLSSLLSEAEKDSARNLHQNKVLKEELRRLERALQRQPHIANTEYLKNIVFKFVTLGNGDERSRLVPVLDTLLKLSPEETHKLSSVARGDTQAGWGSYLPAWTGL